MKLRVKLILSAAATVLVYCTAANAVTHSSDELLKMTIESLSYDVRSDKAFACGVSIISGNDARSRISARRAAITDAQRGFLILRISIKEGRPPRIRNISGYVPPIKVLSEDIRDGLYFVDIETSLSALMKEDDRIRIFDRFFHGTEYEF